MRHGVEQGGNVRRMILLARDVGGNPHISLIPRPMRARSRHNTQWRCVYSLMIIQ